MPSFEQRQATARRHLPIAGDEVHRHRGRHVEATRALTLFLTERCNLRCKYCYEEKRDVDATEQSIDRALELLLQRSRGARRLELHLFGGEPLLRYDLVQYAIESARALGRDYRVRFVITMTTNGTLLDAQRIEYLRRQKVRLTLSLDGHALAQRFNRPPAPDANEVSAASLHANARAADEAGIVAYVRATILPRSFASEDFARLFSLLRAPIAALPADIPNWREAEVDRVIAELARIYREVSTPERLAPLVNINDLLPGIALEARGGTLHRPAAACGAGGPMLAVDARGRVFPCHRFVGSGFTMGHVHAADELELALAPPRADLFEGVDCSACAAELYCGGSCMAHNYSVEGHPLRTAKLHCWTQRAYLREARQLYAELEATGHPGLAGLLGAEQGSGNVHT